jgi:hypothetical protein
MGVGAAEAPGLVGAGDVIGDGGDHQQRRARLAPRSICLICIVLMWLEAVLGLCLGCELHVMLVARGWARGDDPELVCGHGACEVTRAAR